MVLLRIYEAIPAWVVAAALAAAGASFVVVFRWQQRCGVIEYKPALALGVAAVLLALAGSYMWLALTPGATLEARAAVVRVLLLLLSGGLTHYNAGALRLSWRAWRRKGRDE